MEGVYENFGVGSDVVASLLAFITLLVGLGLPSYHLENSQREARAS